MRPLSIKVKEARESFGLTQQELADKSGISQSYIGQVESGKVNPSIKTLGKIAHTLNIETSYFLEQEAGVLFDKYRNHFNDKEKDFLAKQKSRPWITLVEELDEEGLTPEEVREALNMIMSLKLKRDNK